MKLTVKLMVTEKFISSLGSSIPKEFLVFAALLWFFKPCGFEAKSRKIYCDFAPLPGNLCKFANHFTFNTPFIYETNTTTTACCGARDSLL